jgi:hypothetical protein
MMKELNVVNVNIEKPKVQIKIDFPSEPTPPPAPPQQQQLQQQHVLQIEVSDYSDDCPNNATLNVDVDVIGERRKKLEIKCNNFLSMSEPSLTTPRSANFLTVPADVHWGNKQRRCSYIFDDISSSGRSR